MRPSPAVLRLAVCLTSLAPLASAWPNWLPEIEALVVRADETSQNTAKATGDSSATNAASTAAATTDSGSLNTAKPDTDTTDADTATETGTGTDEATKTKSGDNKGTKTGSSKKGKHTTYGPTVYPGGISMLTPDSMKTVTPLYKIGDYVTLGWNYTDVKADPTAIDVLLSRSMNSETWTLTANMSYATKASFIWNTDDQAHDAENPLGTDMYTLIIKDSDASVTDTGEPGYLGSNSQFKFGLYTPQAYTPYADWTCVACSGAGPSFDMHAIKFACSMAIVTFLSFTWFVTGFGIN